MMVFLLSIVLRVLGRNDRIRTSCVDTGGRRTRVHPNKSESLAFNSKGM